MRANERTDERVAQYLCLYSWLLLTIVYPSPLQVKMAEAMKDTTKVMGNMNKMMKPQDVMKNMQAFERESAKLEMSEEMMNDTLGQSRSYCLWVCLRVCVRVFMVYNRPSITSF